LDFAGSLIYTLLLDPGDGPREAGDQSRGKRFGNGGAITARATKIAVRPLDNAELERGVDRLRTLIYPDHPEAYETDWHAAVWGWLGTHPLADEMHRWVLASEANEVVGHLAAVPLYYRVGGERVVAHTPADYQVLPGHGFHALSLMRRFFRTAENCVSVDQVPEAMAVEMRLGAKEAAKLQYAAKILDVSQLPRVPKLLRPALKVPTWGLRALDAALGGVFASGPESQVLDGFDASFDDLFESVAAALPCVPEKDAAFLRWRYGPESPQHPVTVIGVKDGEKLLGYAVLRITKEGDNGYLLDLTTRPGRGDVARSLLRDAVRHFARRGVYIIRYRFLESPASPEIGDLWKLGFIFRNERRHTLLVKFADHGLHKAALDAANWSYNAGDGEMSFWVR
jgi:ribosomal protein S18 acetylase RimI-like enzyme